MLTPSPSRLESGFGRFDPTNALIILDIDGVFTDPSTGSQRVDPGLLALVDSLHTRGVSTAFATGRPFAWVTANLIPAMSDSQRMRPHFFASENGAVISVMNDGAISTRVLDRLKVPDEIRDVVRECADSSKSFLHFDKEKLAMATVFETPGKAGFREWFDAHAPEIVGRLEAKINERGLSSEFRVVRTTIAIDVEHVEGSKLLAANDAADFFLERGSQFKTIIAVGDSPTDANLTRGLIQRFPNAMHHFAFVGEKVEEARAHLSGTTAQFLTHPGYSRGTRVVLNDLISSTN